MDEACKLEALSPTELQFLLFDRGQKQENNLAANNTKGLRDKTNRCPNTKADLIKSS